MMMALLVFNEPLKLNASRGNQGIEVRAGCGGGSGAVFTPVASYVFQQHIYNDQSIGK